MLDAGWDAALQYFDMLELTLAAQKVLDCTDFILNNLGYSSLRVAKRSEVYREVYILVLDFARTDGTSTSSVTGLMTVTTEKNY